MKKLLSILVVLSMILCLSATALASSGEPSGSPSGERGNRAGGMSSHSGVGTTELAEGWEAFTYTYQDASGADAELEYAVYVPEAYDGTTALPLVMYCGDATYEDAGVAAFAAGECPSNWITEENMEKYPCFFLVIGFNEKAQDLTEGTEGAQIVRIIDEVVEKYDIDENRLYLTGQSMGGIMSFALNYAYPDKFAATVYVACQPGDDVGDEQYNERIANGPYAEQTFVYIASALDPRSPSGQAAVMQMLEDTGSDYVFLADLDYQDIASSNADVEALLAEGHARNILQFATVTGGSSAAISEHMESFYYCYELNAIFEWLMQQTV